MQRKFFVFIFVILIFNLIAFGIGTAFADEANVNSTVEFAAKIANFSDDTARAILNIV